jgi:epoxyqueuosine reductase
MNADSLSVSMRERGFACASVPVGRLRELREDFAELDRAGSLDSFQSWIAEKAFSYGLPETPFVPRSLVIVAAPVPPWAEVVLERAGRRVEARSLVRGYAGEGSAKENAIRALEGILAAEGYGRADAPSIPLKRLAVRSGLARYGRNNVTYVEGMGSYLNLSASLTDMPCPDDPWREVGILDRCASCGACVLACPTGALREGRFMTEADRCLSRWNEEAGDFPAWIPPSAHHALYDCLRCTESCPENSARMGEIVGPLVFTETETEALLSGAAPAVLEAGLREKIALLGLGDWWPAIPRNLRALLGPLMDGTGEKT